MSDLLDIAKQFLKACQYDAVFDVLPNLNDDEATRLFCAVLHNKNHHDQIGAYYAYRPEIYDIIERADLNRRLGFTLCKKLIGMGFARPEFINILDSFSLRKMEGVDVLTDFTTRERINWMMNNSESNSKCCKINVNRDKPYDTMSISLAESGETWGPKTYKHLSNIQARIYRKVIKFDDTLINEPELGKGPGVSREAVALACTDSHGQLLAVNDYWILDKDPYTIGILFGLAFLYGCAFPKIAPCIVRRAFTKTSFIAEDVHEYDQVHYDTLVNATESELEELAMPSLAEYTEEMAKKVELFSTGLHKVFGKWSQVFTWDELASRTDEFELWKSQTTYELAGLECGKLIGDQFVDEFWTYLSSQPSQRREAFFKFWTGSSMFPIGRTPKINIVNEGVSITAVTCKHLINVPRNCDLQESIELCIEQQIQRPEFGFV
jgi:hypothetical protein